MKAYKTGMEMAMMDTAGSQSVQMVRSMRSWVTSGLVMEVTMTALTMAVMPALETSFVSMVRMSVVRNLSVLHGTQAHCYSHADFLTKLH